MAKPRKIATDEKAATLAAPDEELLALFGAAPIRPGLPISGERALDVPAVQGATRLLAETVAALPCHLHKRGTDGSKDRAIDDPRYDLLHDRPAPWLTAPEVFEALVTDAIVFGHGFAVAARVQDAVKELYSVPRKSMTVEAEVGQEPVYKLRTKTGERIYSRRDVVHLTIANGRGLVHPARHSIGLLHGMTDYMSGLFRGGARPSGVVEIPGTVDAKVRDNFQKTLDGMNDKRAPGSVLRLPVGAKFTATQFSSVDLQTVEIWRLAILDICRAFRVPPSMLGEMTQATYGNAENSLREFLTLALHPILKRLEGALEIVFLNDDERRSHFIEFATDDLARADLKTRMEAFTKAVGGPWLLANEARSADNRPPVEGGDVLRTPVNMAPAGADPDKEPSNAQ